MSRMVQGICHNNYCYIRTYVYILSTLIYCVVVQCVCLCIQFMLNITKIYMSPNVIHMYDFISSYYS